MKKSIAKKLLLLNAIVLIIFAALSFVTVNISNLKLNSKNMIEKGRIYSEIISGFTDEAEMEEFIFAIKEEVQVTIITSVGSAVYDNQVADLSLYQNFNSSRAFENAKTITPIKAKTDFSNTTLEYSNHIEKSKPMLYVYHPVKINFSDDNMHIVRFGILREFDSHYWGFVFPIVCVMLVLITIVSMFISNKILSALTEPLQEIEGNLSNINRGDYSVKEIKSHYPEINSVVTSIKEMSAKISATMRYLHYEQRKTNIILQSFETGFIALNQTRKIILMNTAAQKIFSNFANAIGQFMSAVTDNAVLLSTIDDAVANKEVLHCEAEIGNASFKITVSAMDTTGLPEAVGIAVLIMFTDISTQIKEQEIRNEFFANASHELRSPLTAIKGFAEISLSAGGNPVIAEKCSTEIDKNATRMLKLINDMLKISRHNARIVDEKPEKIKLKVLCEEIISRLGSLAVDKNINIEIEGEDGNLVGMRLQLEEMLANLVDNAIKYNKDDGSIKITIKNQRSGATIKVADSGIGIPFEHQKRVFESYYRVDKGRDRKIMSTGLGLTIVKNVAEMHNGSVVLDSKPDIGTTFSVTLKNLNIK